MHPFSGYPRGPPRAHPPVPPQSIYPAHTYAQPQHPHPAPTYYAQPQYMHPAPTYAIPHHPAVIPSSSSNSFDAKIMQGRAQGDSKLQQAIYKSPFMNDNARKGCAESVKYLHIHRNLYMHTYEHLWSCCRNKGMEQLGEYMKTWKTWSSIGQLDYYQKIKDTLFHFLEKDRCRQHKLLPAPFVIDADHNDLLYHLLYCGRKHEREFYDPKKMASKDFEQIIELVWKFLMDPNHPPKTDIASRLRAHIYRMSRKCTYIPSSLTISPSGIRIRSQVVASGAYAKINKGELIRDGSEVAIKSMKAAGGREQEARKIFASEAIHWCTLRHENIVQVLGITLDMRGINIITPFFRNGNIRVFLRNHREANKLSLGCEIAKALEYIHNQKPPIYHGDLKGDNVLVDNHGHACITDFGLSYASDSRKYLDSSSVGVAKGPTRWAAPELYLGDTVKVTDKSDIFAFGCVLYEMISGTVPFINIQDGEVSDAVGKGIRPTRPEGVSPSDRLWSIAQYCWHQDPERRPDATWLVKALTPSPSII